MKIRMLKKKVVITLDLDSKKNPNYKTLNDTMRSLGFSKLSPRKQLDLPCNTYIGNISPSQTATQFREKLWRVLKASNLYPTALFGGELEDWSMIRKSR